jgi:hypothetical protein
MATVVNHAQTVPEEIAEALRYYGQERRAAVARQQEIATLASPGDDERSALAEAYRSAGKALGVDVEQHFGRARNIGAKRAALLRDTDLGYPDEPFERVPLESDPAEPDSDDPDFWWSSTTSFLPDTASLSSWGLVLPFKAETLPDGIHFTGKVTSQSGSLHGFSFSAEAMFGIAFERVPETPLHKWTSSPFVEVFGRVDGWTNIPQLFDGDFWSKCWMHRRQTLLQFGFGPTGPVPVVLAEATDSSVVIFNEGHGYMTATLPGHQPMPGVTIQNIAPNTVWAHLEVRFDVQLEGDAGFWVTPPGDIILRFFQWPLVPILPHTSHHVGPGSTLGSLGGH